jgi:hypothetical protein
MPLKIGLAKDMKNTKTCMSSPKKNCFFISQNILKFYLKFFKKTTLLGEGNLQCWAVI